MEAVLLLFQALSDATRLRIVSLLAEMELSVGELAQVLALSQPRTSRHVKILVAAGLTERRREGSWVFLRPVVDPTTRAAATLIEQLAERSGDWRVTDRERLAAIRDERSRQATAYFDTRAEQWDAIRALHIAEPKVEHAVDELLFGRPLGTLVDIGTGTGRMLELLGDRAEHAIGVDRSPEMLRLARAKLAGSDVAADLRQGDMDALPLANETADCVVLHHLLHFAHTPDRTVREAARLLRPGGRLLVIDFASHAHEALRSEHAHVRLGFDDRQMTGWFADAGLEMAQRRSLPGGELTIECWLGERRAGLCFPDKRQAA